MRCFATVVSRMLVLPLALTLFACGDMPEEEESVIDPSLSSPALEPLAKGESGEGSVGVAPTNPIVWCSDKGWKVNFYAEPALINLVGFLSCSCYQPQFRSGTTSSYASLAYEYSCSLD
jgi:hypothetical protein